MHFIWLNAVEIVLSTGYLTSTKRLLLQATSTCSLDFTYVRMVLHFFSRNKLTKVYQRNWHVDVSDPLSDLFNAQTVAVSQKLVSNRMALILLKQQVCCLVANTRQQLSPRSLLFASLLYMINRWKRYPNHFWCCQKNF